jgi:hypothetical protein
MQSAGAISEGNRVQDHTAKTNDAVRVAVIAVWRWWYVFRRNHRNLNPRAASLLFTGSLRTPSQILFRTQAHARQNGC